MRGSSVKRSRRAFLQFVSGSVSLGAIGLLAACGGAAAPGTLAATGSVTAATATAAVTTATASTAAVATTSAAASTVAASTAATSSAISSAVTTSSASATATASVGNATRLVYGSFADAKILTPFLSTDTASNDVIGRVFEGLLNVDHATGAPIPWLAQSYDQSPDGLTYTFHLRKDVKWHDGQPFTADDAKFTYDAIMDPKTKTVRKSNYELVQAFKVVDPYTFQVTLKQSFCPFLLNMTNGLVPKHILEKSADINTDPFGTKAPVGTGPYKFVEWLKDDHVTLGANANYWGGAPKIQQWIMKIVANTTVVAQQLKTGDIDVSGIDPKDLADMEKQTNVNITKYFGLSYDYIGYNNAHPLFQDKRVRQAMTFGLDRQTMINKILFGQAEMVSAPMPPTSWAYNPNVAQYPFDPAKAKALLKEAGWTPGADGMLQKNGQPFKFTLVTNSGNKTREAIVTIAQQQWKDLGIAVDTQLMEWNAFLDKVTKNHDFDACVLGWSLGLDPDAKSIWSSTEIKSGFNFISYNNPQVDKLLEDGRTVNGCGQDQRKQIYGQFQQIIADEQPYTFLWITKSLAVVNKRITGPAITPYGFWWSLPDWTVTA